MNEGRLSAAGARGLVAHLWPQGGLPRARHVYALLDGARDRRIEPMIRASGLEHACLYAGTLAPALQAAAPYLVHLTPGAGFTAELIDAGWGQSWGIITIVPPDVTLQRQRRHFRTLLRVRDTRGRILVFRFYDPRVLRAYLPTCTAEEIAQFFGPISHFAAESADGRQVITYGHPHGRLDVRMVALPSDAVEAPR